MEIKKEFIYEKIENVPSCHASTLLPLPDGKVMAAWFAGEHESNDNVRIWYSVKENGVWSEPQKIFSAENLPHWNPVLDLRNDGTIRLYYKKGKKIKSWVTWFADTKDCGKTWSASKELVENDTSGGRGPVKNKCIRTSEGLLLAPASSEVTKQLWRCFIDVSRDDGDTWTKCDYIVRPRKDFGLVRMIQPTLWEDDNGNIHALMRTDKGRIYKSISVDGGLHWSKAERTEIPNNNSGIDCVRVPDGRIFLVYNNVEENWGGRSPLNLAVSEDNGKTFRDVCELENQKGGEFSYPSITYYNNKLHIAYTYNRKQIMYCETEI